MKDQESSITGKVIIKVLTIRNVVIVLHVVAIKVLAANIALTTADNVVKWVVLKRIMVVSIVKSKKVKAF